MVEQENKDEDRKEHDKKSLDGVYEDEKDDEHHVKGAPNFSFVNSKSPDDLQHQNLTQVFCKLSIPSFEIDAATFNEIGMDVCQIVLYKTYQLDLNVCHKNREKKLTS